MKINRKFAAATLSIVVAIVMAGCMDHTETSKDTTLTTAEWLAQDQTAAADDTTPSLPRSSAVELNEWAIIPAPATVRAGTVTFTAKNTGKVPHEMVVIKTATPADKLGSGSRVSEKGSVGEIADVGAGKSGSVKLHLAAGHYALICNIPGHYAQGMYADLTAK